MKKHIGIYTFELVNDMVMVRDRASGELLKTKTFKPYEAVERFNAICKHWQAKLNEPVS